MSNEKKKPLSDEDAMFIIHSSKNKERRNNLLPPRPVYTPSMQREMAEREAADTRGNELVQKEQTSSGNLQLSSGGISKGQQEQTMSSENKTKQSQKRTKVPKDYKEQFLMPSNMIARLGKSINIRKEYHDWMSSVSATLGDNVSLSSYLDQILQEHFHTHGGTISELLKAETEKQTFKITNN